MNKVRIDKFGNFCFQNMIFSLLLLSLIFFSTGWHVYSYLGDKGIIAKHNSNEFYNLMGHRQTWYAGPDEGKFLSGVFQKTLEKAAADHFPIHLLLIYIKIEQWFNNFFLSIFPLHWAPAVPVGTTVLSLKSEKRLVNCPQIYFKDEYKYLNKRAQYYNKLADNNQNQRFFVFPILQAEEWLAVNNTLWAGSNDILTGDKWVTQFAKLLNSKVRYSWAGKGFSPEEAVSLYYLTDHHFTMQGAYKVYSQLIEIMGKGSHFGYSLRKDSDWFVVENIKFRGVHARLAGKFDAFYDRLEDGDFSLPLLQITINGSNRSQSIVDKKAYLKDIIPTDKFVNHYGKYYGSDHGLIHYICEEAPERTLLVLSDSFDNPITQLLASHYRQSFFVDLRNYKIKLGEKFDLERFIEKHEINDVIFFGRQQRVLGFIPMNN